MKLLPRAANLLALVVLACTLAACKPSDFITPQDESTAKGWIDHLRARHFDVLDKAMEPSLAPDTRAELMSQMADGFPAGEPITVKLVHLQTYSSPQGKLTNLSYEYEFPGRWLLANVSIRTRDGATAIAGLSVALLPSSLEEHYRFGLSGKPAVCYIVLALAILMPSFTVLTLVVCARTRLRGRKWPWMLFILVGIGSISVDWTTGQWDFHVLNFQLLSAGIVSAPFGPWILTAAVPVGALVFLVRRLSLKAPDALAQPAPLGNPASLAE